MDGTVILRCPQYVLSSGMWLFNVFSPDKSFKNLVEGVSSEAHYGKRCMFGKMVSILVAASWTLHDASQVLK